MLRHQRALQGIVLFFGVWLFVLHLTALASGGQGAGEAPLNNEDVIKMVQAKLADAVIVAKIKSSPCKFDTSLDALIKLRQAGISDTVMQAMMEAKAPPPPSNNAVTTPPPPSNADELLRQADALDAQASDADAKAQELENKSNASATGIGGVLRLKYSAQAKRLREKARQYRQQAQQLRAQAGAAGPQHTTETGGGRDLKRGQTSAAESGYRLYDSAMCSLKYPEDWKVQSGQDAVALSPDPMPVDYSREKTAHPSYGAYFTLEHFPSMVREDRFDEELFRALIVVLKREEPMAWGNQLGYATPMTINGRPAQAAEFEREPRSLVDSSKGFKEHVWIVAILPPGWQNIPFDGMRCPIFFVEFLAPEEEFKARRSVFEKIANSIVVKKLSGS